ncbi:hypothetical protein [Bradyrhizobium sp. SZCCHNRI1002]|uniref:hypothetical protein n=1 Tax=Bradyrhizobium sp. SZCCHNRI1002 TaxID=3057274 RepID=UPI0028ECDB35|nr:hypothetical protein [Bradyrhizobium sp. SZCCHNRI1002]
MQLDQYISIAASVGAFLSALATFLTVWQISKQRRATYRPKIVIKRSLVVTRESKDVLHFPSEDPHQDDDDVVKHLLEWRQSIEEFKASPDRIRHYALPVLNAGLGAATDISVYWEFPMVSFVSATHMLAVNRGHPERIDYRNGLLRIERPSIISAWRNQDQDHIDYILPAAIDKEPVKLQIPHAYILAVSTRMALFCRDDGEERDLPTIPALKVVFSYKDISDVSHRISYEIEFDWHSASPNSFEAELIPKRV